MKEGLEKEAEALDLEGASRPSFPPDILQKFNTSTHPLATGLAAALDVEGQLLGPSGPPTWLLGVWHGVRGLPTAAVTEGITQSQRNCSSQ